jgi:hypothetical protein
MTAVQRQRRHRLKQIVQEEPKHYLVEAIDLFDRIEQTLSAKAAQKIFHWIALEAAKRQRRRVRLDKLATK